MSNYSLKDTSPLIVVVVAAILIFCLGAVVFAEPAPKVTICHATSSETNPWTRIVVSENAIGGHFDNPGTPKAGHEDDVLLEGDVACPVTEVPLDVCDNIEGDQAEVPEGYIEDNGICDKKVEVEEPETPQVLGTSTEFVGEGK